MKKVQIIHSAFEHTIVEQKTMIGEAKVFSVDTSKILSHNLITCYDEDGELLSEIFLSQDAVVFVDYHKD